MFTTTLTKLCEEISTPNELTNRQKALKIIAFAEAASDQILLRAGFPRSSKDWEANSIAISLDRPSYSPDDELDINALALYKVPATLNARADQVGTDELDTAHEFVFCKTRVIMGDGVKLRTVFTYEEAARFILYWIMEKILQIGRKNNWDRLAQMPNLFDRMATLFNETL